MPDALLEYGSRLERARIRMPDWHCPVSKRNGWHATLGCRRHLSLARRLREEAPDLGGFEGLLGTVEALMDPLTPFEEADRAFLGLRT